MFGLTFPKMVFGSWGFVMGGMFGIMAMPQQGIPLRWALPIALALAGAYVAGGIGERRLRKVLQRLDRG